MSEKGAAFRKWMGSRTAENRKNYKTKRKQANAAKRNAKQEKWKQIIHTGILRPILLYGSET